MKASWTCRSGTQYVALLTEMSSQATTTSVSLILFFCLTPNCLVQVASRQPHAGRRNLTTPDEVRVAARRERPPGHGGRRGGHPAPQPRRRRRRRARAPARGGSAAVCAHVFHVDKNRRGSEGGSRGRLWRWFVRCMSKRQGCPGLPCALCDPAWAWSCLVLVARCSGHRAFVSGPVC